MIGRDFSLFAEGFMPDKDPGGMNLYQFVSPGVFGTPVYYRSARKKPPTEDVKSYALSIQISSEICTISLWSTGIASQFPKDGDVIQRSNGERWTIYKVRNTVQGNLFQCDCMKEVGT